MESLVPDREWMDSFTNKYLHLNENAESSLLMGAQFSMKNMISMFNDLIFSPFEFYQKCNK